MPTYEYRCRECGEHLEVVQAFSDDPLTECPACGGLLRKLFNSVGISFKGSGFYRNDSRTKAGASTSSSSGSSSSSSSDSGSGSSSGDSSSSSSTDGGSSSKADSSSGSGSSGSAAATKTA
jgi:putative FmdB family regulatory protein